MAPPELQVFVAGSYISVLARTVNAMSLPPITSALPLGRAAASFW